MRFVLYVQCCSILYLPSCTYLCPIIDVDASVLTATSSSVYYFLSLCKCYHYCTQCLLLLTRSFLYMFLCIFII